MNWKLVVGSLILLSFASVVVWGLVAIGILWQFLLTFVICYVLIGAFALGIKWFVEGWIEWCSKKGEQK